MNFKKRKKLKSSIVRSWLFSYFSVLIIPLLISFVIYFFSVQTVENEINRANKSLMNQIKETLDSQMRDVERLSSLITLNLRFQGLMNLEGDLDSHHRYVITQIIRDFKVYNATHDFIDEFYIYLRNPKIVITPNSIYELDLAYKVYHDKNEISYEEWYESIKEIHNRNYVPLKIEDKNEFDVSYFQSMPLQDLASKKATLVILFNDKKFESALDNLQILDSGISFILDENNTIISSTDETDFLEYFQYSDFEKSSDTLYKKMNKEDMVISYVSSDATKWKYVSITPRGIFLKKASNIKNLTAISILFCLIVGGLVSYYFTKKNYVPVSEIIRTLSGKSNPSFTRDENEYKYIKDSITSTINEKRIYDEKLKEQAISLRLNFLSNLIKGTRKTKLSIEQSLKSFGINFDTDYFATMIFFVEDFDRLFLEEEEYIGYENQTKLVNFIIQNIMGELLSEDNNVFFTEVNGMLVCLINLKTENTDLLKENLIKGSKRGIEIIEENFYINFTVAISNFCKGVLNIPQEYNNVMEAMEYKMVIKDKKVIHFDEINNRECNYKYDIETEKRLINFIKVGDFEKAKDIVNSVFKNNFTDQNMSSQMTKCLVFDLTSTLIKVLEDLSLHKDHMIEELKPIDKLLNLKTTKDMKKEMINILYIITKHIDINKRTQSEELRNNIIEFVNENYNDSNLSIPIISEHFNLSSGHLSRQFREQMDESLVDFINKTRIKNAKEMLENTGDKISTVAQKVGFISSHTFIRTFKKYEGITPGQYKEMF